MSQSSELAGQTAVVTGAGGAIGAAICIELANAGAEIVAADVDQDALAETVALLEDRGTDPTAVSCDVSDPEDCHELRRTALANHDSVEIVVAAAGIDTPGRNISIADLTLEEWQTVLDVNLTGVFLVVRAFYEHMVDNEYGKVVTIGSMAGATGSERPGPNYAASKGGVHAFTRWLATQGAADGVYANAIAPGPVWTPMTRGKAPYSETMTPINRLGRPEDVAHGVRYLVSPRAQYITGTTLHMNGGLFMR